VLDFFLNFTDSGKILEKWGRQRKNPSINKIYFHSTVNLANIVLNKFFSLQVPVSRNHPKN
jgi:hypothetical protein